MSATGDNTTDWAAQAVALRRDQQMATAEIAEMFGKSASQVRKVISAANTERAINGAPERDNAGEWQNEAPGAIPGQTNIESALTDEANPEDVYPVPPEDDPEHTADPLDDFRAEAGDAVGPMPPDPNPPEPQSYEVRVAGTRQMALDFGENASLPTGATIVLKSEKRPSGFYGLGDVFSGTFTARVTKAPGEETFDKDMGEYMTKDVAYGATITEFSITVEADG